MLVVACALWDANAKSQPFSRCYDNSWVEKLYRGFKRNLTREFRFVCFTDRHREFKEPIEQERLLAKSPDYGCLIEPFKLDVATIICGLDTVIVGNLDHFADYCLNETKIALPRNPYKPEESINAVALVPKGHRHIFEQWRGENDMQWLRKFPWQPIDDYWPGEVVSLKAGKVRDVGIGNARIIYFHGEPKPPSLMHLDWVRRYWV